jgi:hypothetical protein
VNSAASKTEDNRPAIFSIYKGLSEDIKAVYPSLEVLTEPPRDKEGYKAGTVIVECVDIESTRQPGTGELQVETRWEVRIILHSHNDRGEPLGIAARIMCLELGHKIHNRVYSRQSFPINYERSYDENFDGKASNLEVWVSEYSCVVRFGKNEWNGIGIYPSSNANSEWVKEKVFSHASSDSRGTE